MNTTTMTPAQLATETLAWINSILLERDLYEDEHHAASGYAPGIPELPRGYRNHPALNPVTIGLHAQHVADGEAVWSDGTREVLPDVAREFLHEFDLDTYPELIARHPRELGVDWVGLQCP